jgi:hypothetical protein
MNAHKRDAEACMVAICAHLSMSVVQDENFGMWMDCLNEVLRDCDECSLALVDMRTSATIVVNDRSPQALARLQLDVRDYYRMAAAKRFETLQNKAAEAVIEDAA